MTQPSGWYDDPQDPSQLRYWDGVIWSNHVTPKVSPTVEQSNIGMPYGVAPAAARAPGPGAYGAQGPPTAPGYAPPPQDQLQQGQGGRMPAYGQRVGWQSHAMTTPDGVPLAGWWMRVLARFLDGLFTGLLALPFTGWFYYQYFVGVLDWSDKLVAQSESATPPIFALPPAEVMQYAFEASLIMLAVGVIYEVFFLSRSGATPGKKIVGISVRLRERPGPPPMRAVLGRAGCYYLFSLIGIISLLDVLWPLWDDKKQAIHDKVASTNVVVGRQPKRDA